MSFSARTLLDDPKTISPRLRAQLRGYLRCAEEVRAAVRERLCEDPLLADWCDLLEELEAGGEVLREAVRGSLEGLGVGTG